MIPGCSIVGSSLLDEQVNMRDVCFLQVELLNAASESVSVTLGLKQKPTVVLSARLQTVYHTEERLSGFS